MPAYRGSPTIRTPAGWMTGRATDARLLEAERTSLLPRVVLSGLSVGTVWGAAVAAPESVGVVLLVVSAAWGFLAPFDFLLMVFPSLLPLAVAEVVGFGGRSAFALALGAFIFAAATRRERRRSFSLRGVPRPVLLGWFWILGAETLSALIVPGTSAYVMVLVRVVRITVFLSAAVAAVREPDLRKLAVGWVYLGGLVAGSALVLQHEFGSVLALRGSAQWGFGTVGQVAAMVANMGYLAVASAAATLGLATQASVAWLAPGSVFAFVVGVGTFYSGRRQALLALAACGALVVLAHRRGRAVLVAMSVLVATVLFLAIGPVREFLTERASFFAEFQEGERNTGYLAINAVGLSSFLKSPVVGVGLGNYAREAAREGVGGGVGGVGLAAHNSVILILAETGLMGGLGALLLVIGIGSVALRAWLSLRKGVSTLATLIASGLGALVLTGLAVTLLDDVGYCYVGGEFVGFCALVAQQQRRGPLGGSRDSRPAASDVARGRSVAGESERSRVLRERRLHSRCRASPKSMAAHGPRASRLEDPA